MMTTFEAISLMLAFGMLLITLLAYLDRNNKQYNKKYDLSYFLIVMKK